MKKFFLPLFTLFFSLTINPNLFAAYGYLPDCSSFMIIDGTFYEIAPCSSTSSPLINGVNFGSVTSLTMTYLEQNTMEDSGDDVITGFFNFRRYSGAPSGGFVGSFLPITNMLGGGLEQRVDNPAVDVTSGLSPGTYTFEFYFNSEVATSGGGFENILDDNGGANYSFTFTIDAPAPVELSQFKAIELEENIELQWQTSTAINSSHFEIQKSTDSRIWETIGKQDSEAAYSNTTTTYSFIDHRPYNGKNYYRLKMVDLDGKEEFSEVVVTEWRKNEVITFYPNPVRDQLNFTFTDKEIGLLKIYNTLGQLVSTHQLAGDQEQSMSIQVDDLLNGLHIIQWYNKQGILIDQDQFMKE